jgi:signal transduction histidine kinase
MADAVSELLANTRKYATGASTVTLSLESTPAGARLVVSDDGPGLDAKTREGLFQPWSGTDPGSKSSGLGLALIREGLAQINATICCEPSEKGARFVIDVPGSARA